MKEITNTTKELEIIEENLFFFGGLLQKDPKNSEASIGLDRTLELKWMTLNKLCHLAEEEMKNTR